MAAVMGRVQCPPVRLDQCSRIIVVLNKPSLGQSVSHKPLRHQTRRVGRRVTTFAAQQTSGRGTEKGHALTRIPTVSLKREEDRKMDIGGLPQQLAVAAFAVAASAALMVPAANAADALKTCSCLLENCRLELARCIADPKCAANIACLQTCNNRPDETECQIKCGDLFENPVVDQFNTCAVSQKGCVPQKQDEGLFPVPPPDALVQGFDTRRFDGPWYITAGLNPTFDTFDCQLHRFTGQDAGFSVDIRWRINTPDGGFFERKALQNFVQDPKQPGVLLNHGNEFLHYQDDWYVLSSKMEGAEDDYVLVYYRGSNDAWDGYGGGVVYTRSSTLPPSIVPEVTAALQKVNVDFAKFKETDNTCAPAAPLYVRLYNKGVNFVKGVVDAIVREEEIVVEEIEKEERMLLNLFEEEERELANAFSREELELLDKLNMKARDIEETFNQGFFLRKSK